MPSRRFPYRIGYDAAGTITQIGDDVKQFKVGDAVYVRLPEMSRGSWAEYVVVDEFFVAPKPSSLSFEEAASIPLAAIISMQALELYEGGLKGKTVFVPAGCKSQHLLQGLWRCWGWLIASSKWNGPYGMSVGQECLRRWESHYDRVDIEGCESAGTVGRGRCR